MIYYLRKNYYKTASLMANSCKLAAVLGLYNSRTVKDRWELPGNCPVFTVVMEIYHYVERIWRILVTPNTL